MDYWYQRTVRRCYVDWISLMSDVKKNYTKEELDRMSNAELAALG